MRKGMLCVASVVAGTLAGCGGNDSAPPPAPAPAPSALPDTYGRCLESLAKLPEGLKKEEGVAPGPDGIVAEEVVTAYERDGKLGRRWYGWRAEGATLREYAPVRSNWRDDAGNEIDAQAVTIEMRYSRRTLYAGALSRAQILDAPPQHHEEGTEEFSVTFNADDGRRVREWDDLQGADTPEPTRAQLAALVKREVWEVPNHSVWSDDGDGTATEDGSLATRYEYQGLETVDAGALGAVKACKLVRTDTRTWAGGESQEATMATWSVPTLGVIRREAVWRYLDGSSSELTTSHFRSRIVDGVKYSADPVF